MSFNIFKKKTEISLEDFCQDFYTKNIFPPKIDGIDYEKTFFDEVIKSVMEADPNFSKISSQNLIDELTIIRLEVFAIAFLHQYGEKQAVLYSIFTKDYLYKSNRQKVWDNSEPYNQAVAQSSTYGKNSNIAVDRGQISFINSMRVSLFDKYTKKGYDPVCIARSINRYSTETAWAQSITAGLLTITLCRRLSCEINDEAMFRLTAIIRGFYDGAKQNLVRIKIK